MRRRTFLSIASAAAAFPRLAFAQQPGKVPRVALLDPTVPVDQISEASSNLPVAVFLKELRAKGFIDGTSVSLERWSGNSEPSTYADVTKQAIASNPDLVFIFGSAAMSQAAVAATKTIPILFNISDALLAGLVTNLDHPGGNATGVQGGAEPGIEGKVLGIIHEAVPTARKIAFLASTAGWAVYETFLTDSAKKLGLEPVAVIPNEPVGEATYRNAFAGMAAQGVDMIQMTPAPEINSFAPVLGNLAKIFQFPAISPYAAFIDGGGLMSYGSNIPDQYRKAADQVALVLDGAKPGDLPVLQADAYDFIVNLAAAKDLGLALPPTIVASATELRQ